MFKKEPEVNRAQGNTAVVENERASVIGRSMKLKGNISADEEILIEGRVEGTIKITLQVATERPVDFLTP